MASRNFLDTFNKINKDLIYLNTLYSEYTSLVKEIDSDMIPQSIIDRSQDGYREIFAVTSSDTRVIKSYYALDVYNKDLMKIKNTIKSKMNNAKVQKSKEIEGKLFKLTKEYKRLKADKSIKKVPKKAIESMYKSTRNRYNTLKRKMGYLI